MSAQFSPPLGIEELIDSLRTKLGFCYDIRVIVRGEKIYFQIMWSYLEQKSFPLTEEEYRNHLGEVLDIVNRLGQASVVRKWLLTLRQKPIVGRAISLPLKTDYRYKEFVLGISR